MQYPSFLVLPCLLLFSPSAFADDFEVADKTEMKITRVDQHTLTGVVSGRKVKVRLLGLTCSAKKSTKRISKLVKGKKVILRSDKAFLPILKDTQDRFVAYVDFKGADLGATLIEKGICVGTTNRTHPKEASYASR